MSTGEKIQQRPEGNDALLELELDEDQQVHLERASQLVERMLTPSAKRKKFALAAGQKTRPFPAKTARLVSKVRDTLDSKLTTQQNNHRAVTRVRLELQERIAALTAVKASAEQATELSTLSVRLLEHSRQAWQLHVNVGREMKRIVRPVEVVAREYYSFIANCRLPGKRRSEIMDRVSVVPLDAQELAAHKVFGTVGCMPPRKDEARKHLTPWLLVVGGEIKTPLELQKLGSTAKEAGGYAIVSASHDVDVDELREDDVKGVWLHQVAYVSRPFDPVYERPGDDLYISGSWKSAGDRMFVGQVSREHGRGSCTTGCRPGHPFSPEYAYMPKGYPVFRDDYTHKYPEIPIDFCVGVTETDPQTKRIKGYLHGANLFQTSKPTSTVPTNENLNELTVDLDILGKRLLQTAKFRAETLRGLQLELIRQYVGDEPKSFSWLKLSEDRKSTLAQGAIAAGGVLVRADLKVNGVPTFVWAIITPTDDSVQQGPDDELTATQ